MDKSTYTAAEAAQYLGVSKSTLYRRLTQKGLSAKKHPTTGQNYYDQEILDQLQADESNGFSEDQIIVLSEQISQMALVLQDIQKKQDAILELLHKPSPSVSPTVKAETSPPSAQTIEVKVEPVKEEPPPEERISPKEYTLQLLTLCEQNPAALNSSHPLMKKLKPENLDRGLLAAEMDKAWLSGNNTKKECVMKLLKQFTQRR